MASGFRIFFIFSVLLTQARLTNASQAYEAGGARPDPAIENALISNEQALAPVRVTWVQKLVSPLSKEELLKALNEKMILLQPETKSVAWDAGKMYVKDRLGSGAEVEYSFDGTVFYMGTPTELLKGRPRPELSKSFNSVRVKKNPNGLLYTLDFFAYSGFRLPSTPRTLSEMKGEHEILWLLRNKAHLASQSEIAGPEGTLRRLVLDAQNQERIEAEQSDIAKLRKIYRDARVPGQVAEEHIRSIEMARQLPAVRTYVFDLDPKTNFAVRAREERYGDQVLCRTRNSAFVEIGGRNIWMPMHSETEFFTYRTRPGFYFASPPFREVIDVQNITGEPLYPTQFVLNYLTPGTEVTDHTAPSGEVFYTIPAGPSELDATLGKVQRQPVSRLNWPVVLIINVLAAVVILFVWLRKARGSVHAKEK